MPEPFLQQVTFGPGDPANPSVVAKNASTLLVAFDAYGSFNGGTGPSTTRRQIYVKNLKNGEISQLTRTADGDNTRATISGGGGLVTFESTAPSLHGFPIDTSQIVAIEFGTPTPARWVPSKGGRGHSKAPMPNHAGNVVVFESTADLMGDLTDTGTVQVFVAEIDRNNAPLFEIEQVTAGNAASQRPFVSDNGGLVVFESTATDLPGAIPGPGTQVYSAPLLLGSQPTVTRLTDAAVFGDCSWPSLNEDNSRIAVICTGDPLQNGTQGNRAFILDPTQPFGVRQINAVGNVQGPIPHTLGNYFIAMATREDMAGTGACEHQVTIVDYFSGRWFFASARGQIPTGLPPEQQGPPSAGCNDHNPCSADTCLNPTNLPTRSCTYAPTAGACSDGNACTTGDTCTAGVCLGGATPNCDDGNLCTTDACDPATGCTHVPNTVTCDDGNPCTVGDTCVNGSCQGSPLECPVENRCEGTRTCDPATGECTPGPPLACNDGNACTADRCDPALGCVHTDTTDTCDDGNPCTATDLCADGTCIGSGNPCDDADECTIDQCGTNASCQYAPVDNFLLCELRALQAGVERLAAAINAEPVKVGSAARQRRLLRRIGRARRQIGSALAAPEKRLVKILRAVDRVMRAFEKDVDGGTTMDPAMKATLLNDSGLIRSRSSRVVTTIAPTAKR